MNPNFNCVNDCNKYIEKMLVKLEGCTDRFKMMEAIFSTFNHLSVYYPEAYQHMLKVWENENE